jgi:hypothetical protein
MGSESAKQKNAAGPMPQGPATRALATRPCVPPPRLPSLHDSASGIRGRSTQAEIDDVLHVIKSVPPPPDLSQRAHDPLHSAHDPLQSGHDEWFAERRSEIPRIETPFLPPPHAAERVQRAEPARRRRTRIVLVSVCTFGAAVLVLAGLRIGIQALTPPRSPTEQRAAQALPAQPAAASLASPVATTPRTALETSPAPTAVAAPPSAVQTAPSSKTRLLQRPRTTRTFNPNSI